jgi:hypothetical protein
LPHANCPCGLQNRTAPGNYLFGYPLKVLAPAWEHISVDRKFCRKRFSGLKNGTFSGWRNRQKSLSFREKSKNPSPWKRGWIFSDFYPESTVPAAKQQIFDLLICPQSFQNTEKLSPTSLNSQFSIVGKEEYRGKNKEKGGIFPLGLCSVFYIAGYFSVTANENWCLEIAESLRSTKLSE